MAAARRTLKLGFLDVKKTVFLSCDIQELFREVISNFSDAVDVANKMAKAARIIGVNVYVSEQYPKALGPTTKDLDVSGATLVYPKTSFSMLTPELLDSWTKAVPQEVESVVLYGLATHVCVEQTAMDLLEKNIAVHVLADGCDSRSQLDRRLALERLSKYGCFITTSENVLFKLVQGKTHPHFKEILQLVRDPMVDNLTPFMAVKPNI